MLYHYNHGFYWYAVDKHKNAYFKSVSYRKVIDFINGQANKQNIPQIIERL
jgi:hypothetical protein